MLRFTAASRSFGPEPPTPRQQRRIARILTARCPSITAPRSLDLVVTSVATQLMAANAATSVEGQPAGARRPGRPSSEWTSASCGTTITRSARPDWSPSGRPARTSPTRTLSVWCTSPTPIRSSPISETRQEADGVPARTRDRRLPAPHRGIGRAVPATRWRPHHWCPASSPPACSASSSSATGQWAQDELNALEAIASLFAQVQARVLAEDQLRYLAEHDDLTGLHNRRALVAHLDARLAAGQTRTRLGAVLRPRPAQGRSTTTSATTPATGSSGCSPNVCARRPASAASDRPARRRRIRRRPRDPMDAESAEELAYHLQIDAARTGGHRRRDAHPDRQHRCGAGRAGPRHHLGSAAPGRSGGADREELRGQQGRACSPTTWRCGATFRNDIELHLQSVIDSGALVSALPARDRHAHR